MARPPSDIDATAREILFRKHWSPSGWTKGAITLAEFEYAKQAGIMFDPVDITHDAVIARAIKIRGAVDPADVGRAFLASLSTRRFDWRSALGSLAAIRHLPDHAGSHSGRCAICGEAANSSAVDLNELSFERLKWGGVRHWQPHYATLDLECFSRDAAPRPKDADWEIMAEVIQAISQLPVAARPNDIEKSIRGLFPSNRWERRIVIDTLGLAGITIPRNRPTFWGEYPLNVEREGPSNKNDWTYPVVWWTGKDGINRDALRFWFPGFV